MTILSCGKLTASLCNLDDDFFDFAVGFVFFVALEFLFEFGLALAFGRDFDFLLDLFGLALEFFCLDLEFDFDLELVVWLEFGLDFEVLLDMALGLEFVF